MDFKLLMEKKRAGNTGPAYSYMTTVSGTQEGLSSGMVSPITLLPTTPYCPQPSSSLATPLPGHHQHLSVLPSRKQCIHLTYTTGSDSAISWWLMGPCSQASETSARSRNSARNALLWPTAPADPGAWGAACDNGASAPILPTFLPLLWPSPKLNVSPLPGSPD